MKILIVTQKIDLDDDNLAFFHGWLAALAKKADLFVIANFVGRYDLLQNVKIFSLGKEKGRGRILKYLRYKFLLFRLLPRSDGIFFHMCPEYIIGAGFCPKFFGKKSLFWYTHKTVNWRLRLSAKLVDKIFTASSESCRIKSSKIEITGHGIDIKNFQFPISNFQKNSRYKIITVGRITPIKNLDALIEAADILRKENFNFEIEIAGAPIMDTDKIYLSKLKEMIAQKNLENHVKFPGVVKYEKMRDFYLGAGLLVNLSDTGSIDKVVLEAMAGGINALTSNEAFKKILPAKYLTDKKPESIAQKIILLCGQKPDMQLSEYVFKNHNIENLVSRILNFFSHGK